MRRALTSRDWFGKSSAAFVLGFLLALGGSGLFRVMFGLKDAFFSTQGQFAMWLMSPIWAFTLAFCFLFRSSARAWGWLTLANVAVWGAVWMLGGIRA